MRQNCKIFEYEYISPKFRELKIQEKEFTITAVQVDTTADHNLLKTVRTIYAWLSFIGGKLKLWTMMLVKDSKKFGLQVGIKHFIYMGAVTSNRS